jgi:hypothetical protein
MPLAVRLRIGGTYEGGARFYVGLVRCRDGDRAATDEILYAKNAESSRELRATTIDLEALGLAILTRCVPLLYSFGLLGLDPNFRSVVKSLSSPVLKLSNDH